MLAKAYRRVRVGALLFSMLLLLALGAPASAGAVTVLTVDPTASGTNIFSTIQGAIDYAATQLASSTTGASFEIHVAANSSPYAGFTIKNSGVPIIGASTSGTIVSSAGNSIVTVSGLTSSSGVLIRNLTLRGGSTGIAITNSSAITVENIVFQLGGAGTGIAVTGGSSVLIHNNTFVNNNIAIRTNADLTITNNIFASNTTAISSSVTLSEPTYNDFSANVNNGITITDNNSLPSTQHPSANPQFVDPAGDFHLKSSSPCKNAGNPLYPNSFNASTFDIGAYGGPHADIPVPPAVTGVAATVSVSGSTASLAVSWNATSSTDVTAYRVYFGNASRSYQNTQSATQSSPVLVPTGSTSTTITGTPVATLTAPTTPQSVTVTPQDGAIALSWSAVSGATGYRILYGTAAGALTSSQEVAGGSTTAATVSGLANGTPYFAAVTAVTQQQVFVAVSTVIDNTVAPSFGTATANESGYSAEKSAVVAEQASASSTVVSATPEAPVPFPNLKGEGCFIATAAFGFYSAPQVQALRDFRDHFLLTNAPGRAFVAWYYHYGPRGAHYLNQHPWLKAPVRVALFPLILLALVLNSPAAAAKGALLVLALGWVTLVRRRRVAQAALFSALCLLALPHQVRAEDANQRPNRPHWSLEVKGGVFFPGTADWSKFNDSNFMGQYGGSVAYKVHRQVEVGIGGSYLSTTGKGQLVSSGAAAGEVSYQLAPLELFALWRGVFDENQLLVPYAGGGYTRLFYREELKGHGSVDGAVNGYHARGGIQFLLDRIEPGASRSLYQEWGIHHSYFFVEGKYLDARADTVAGGSVQLGGVSTLGGLLLEF